MVGYIGRQAVNGNFVKLDSITTSATTTFNLLNGGVAYYPESARNCIVSLNGVIQSPETAYNIVSNTIVFSTALTSDDVIDHIIVLGDVNALATVSDGTVTASKLGTDAVIEAKIQDNAVTTNKINNDAITIDKINLITSASAPSLEAKGSGSNSGKIVLNCENNSHGVSIQAPAHANFSGNYTLTLPTSDGNADEFLKTDGSGVLTWGSAGGTNTPSFQARSNSAQSLTNAVHHDIVFGEEIFDTDNAFASNVFTVPSGKAGKYLLYAQAGRQNWDSDRFLCYLARTRSGATADLSASESHDGQGYHTTNTLCIADLQVGDVVKVVVYHDSGSTRSISTGDRTTFQGFKLL